MDENNENVVATTDETTTSTTDNPTVEKKFTQSELDNVVKNRLAKSEKALFT